jgi:hypothetical protein
VRRIVVHLKDPVEVKTLHIGREVDRGGQGSRLYARVEGDKSIALVDSKSLGEVPVEAEHWRDRTLLDFQRDEVVRLEIRRSDGALACRKTGENAWEIVEPKRVKADFLQVNDLLWTLKDARVERFLDGAPPFASWRDPAVQVSIWLEDREDPLRLVVGGPTADGRDLFARGSAQDGAVVVSPKILEDVKVSVKDLRERRLMRFEVPDIHRVQVVWEEQTLDLIRDGDVWRGRPPKRTEAGASEVQGLLWTLKELKFEEELEDRPSPAALGEDRPRVRITLWTAGGDAIGPLAIGKALPDPPGSGYAWMGEGSPVYVMETKILEELKRDVEEIRPDFFSGKGKG